MPIFFFHFYDGETLSSDDQGLVLDNTELAYLEAVATARSLWPELLAERCDPRKCSFLVAGGDGAELFRLELSELLDDCWASATGHALIDTLMETQQKAAAAQANLRDSFEQVYRSLGEVSALLARFSAFERPPAVR